VLTFFFALSTLPSFRYKAKKADVEGLVDPVFFRFEEHTARPEAVAAGLKRLKDIKTLMAKWEEKMPQVSTRCPVALLPRGLRTPSSLRGGVLSRLLPTPIPMASTPPPPPVLRCAQVTDEEKADVLALVEKAEAWIEDKVAAQGEVAGHEPPIFTAAEVAAQIKPTANLVTKLSRKPKPKPPALNITNATTGNGTNATGAGNGTDGAGMPEVVEEAAPLEAEEGGEAKAAEESEAAKEEGEAKTAAGDDEL